MLRQLDDEEINNNIEEFTCMVRWEIYWDQYFWDDAWMSWNFQKLRDHLEGNSRMGAIRLEKKNFLVFVLTIGKQIFNEWPRTDLFGLGMKKSAEFRQLKLWTVLKHITRSAIYKAPVFKALEMQSSQAFFIWEIVTTKYALGESALDTFNL